MEQGDKTGVQRGGIREEEEEGGGIIESAPKLLPGVPLPGAPLSAYIYIYILISRIPRTYRR